MSNPEIYMRKAGPAIKVKFKPNNGNEVSWVVPVSGDKGLTLSIQHKTVKPIETFMSSLFSFLGKAFDGVIIVDALLETAQTLGQTIGMQFGSKWLQAQAWAGSEPTSFNIDMNFFLGNRDNWNAQLSVYEPVKKIMSYIAPGGDVLALVAPMPSGMDIYAAYGLAALFELGNVIKKIAKSFKPNSTSEDAEEQLQKVSYEVSKSMSGKQDDFNKILKMNIWDVEFGYVDSHIKFIPLYKINNLIAKSGVMTFSKDVQKMGGNYYPISGTVQIKFESLSITTSEEINQTPSNNQSQGTQPSEGSSSSPSSYVFGVNINYFNPNDWTIALTPFGSPSFINLKLDITLNSIQYNQVKSAAAVAAAASRQNRGVSGGAR